jgi:hypothetical protein
MSKDIKNVTIKLNAVPFDTFGNHSVQLTDSEVCVTIKEDYFRRTKDGFLLMSCVHMSCLPVQACTKDNESDGVGRGVGRCVAAVKHFAVAL